MIKDTFVVNVVNTFIDIVGPSSQMIEPVGLIKEELVTLSLSALESLSGIYDTPRLAKEEIDLKYANSP